MATERVIRSTCMMSHSGCGILVHVRDGRVVKVEGDPDHPLTRGSLCPKGLAAMQFEYHPDRLLYPHKRRGERGGGQWERISWDEALDTIAGRLKDLMERYGPESVAVACGTGRPILNYARRFGSTLGTPHHAGLPHICWRPQLGAATVLFGRPIHYDLKGTQCIVVVGANWLHSAFGQSIFPREFMDAWKAGAKIICVDPRLSPIASKSDVWLQLRPGTDAALLLSWINVIIEENLYDADFVRNWTVGFDELKEHVRGFTPEWAEGITWVPAEEIRRAARMYAASRPANATVGVAVEQSTNSLDTLRAFYTLVAITGNVDVPGGNHFWENPLPSSRVKELIGRELIPSELKEKMIGGYPLVEGSSPGYSLWQAIATRTPSQIKAVMVHGSNPVLTQENPLGLVTKALKGVEFLVVADYFMTPTAELADIVLPAATFLEKDDVNLRPVLNRGLLSVARKAVEPLGEARDDREIFIELLKRMGLDYGFGSVRELLDWILEPAGMTFGDLSERGWAEKTPRYRKYELGVLRPDGKPGFNTSSGKIEIYSESMIRMGLNALPGYKEPPDSPVSSPELNREYPLVLTTGARRPAFFHTQYHQIPWLREITPEPELEIHPDTAAGLGISDGDWAIVEDHRGKARFKARITPGIDPRVVHTDYAWWYPSEPGALGSDASGVATGLHGAYRSNPNLLVSSDPPYDGGFGSTQLRGLLCRVYKEG